MDKTVELRTYAKGIWHPVGGSDQSKGVPMPPFVHPSPEGAVLYDLPAPERCPGTGKDFLTLINTRRSVRQYKDASMTLEQLSYLLHVTQGVTGPTPMRRAAPSAGARHAFETYLSVRDVESLPRGTYRYIPTSHKLELIKEWDESLVSETDAALNNQKFPQKAQVVFFWAADMYRCEWRYTENAYRLVLIDVGHVCENLYLACGEIGCGCCAIAAYDQKRADALFGLDGERNFILYAAPTGVIR